MEEVKRNSLQAWILAARPKTLTGAITPVMIGTALAAMDGRFHGFQRWGVQDPARPAVRPLRLRHANCRKFHQ